MNLLVVNNATFIGTAGRSPRVARQTASFAGELARLMPGLGMAQGRAGYAGIETQADAEITPESGIELRMIRWDTATLLRRLLCYPRALPWLLRETYRADALYIFLPGHLPLLFVAAARLLRRPYGVYLRGELGARRLRFALRGARFVLTTSDLARREVARFCADAEVVTPMIDLGPEAITSPRPLRRTPPWQLLFVGAVERAKGVPELLQAVRLLQSQGIAVRLDVAGGSIEARSLRLLATSLALDDVRFHGVLSPPAIRELYTRADLLVLPTHSEGFPRVLYEAMAYGVPVVTTFVGGIPSRMEDGVNCLRAPLRDAAGLARTIERALADPGLRERMVAGGRATMRELLSPDRPSHAQQVARRFCAPARGGL